MPDFVTKFAAEVPLAPGHYRVVVSHGGGNLDRRDFDDLERAKVYADDVVSEWSEEPQFAYVYDGDFTEIYRGKAYFSG